MRSSWKEATMINSGSFEWRGTTYQYDSEGFVPENVSIGWGHVELTKYTPQRRTASEGRERPGILRPAESPLCTSLLVGPSPA